MSDNNESIKRAIEEMILKAKENPSASLSGNDPVIDDIHRHAASFNKTITCVALEFHEDPNDQSKVSLKKGEYASDLNDAFLAGFSAMYTLGSRFGDTIKTAEEDGQDGMKQLAKIQESINKIGRQQFEFVMDFASRMLQRSLMMAVKRRSKH